MSRVVVIGGGASGLVAAIYAAKRGHNVTIYEAREKTGGQLVAAAYPPSKGEFATFTCWANKQLQDLADTSGRRYVEPRV